MIEPITPAATAEPQRAKKAPDAEQPFSLALAAASLEARAGAALKMHGGAPEGATDAAFGGQTRASTSEPAASPAPQAQAASDQSITREAAPQRDAPSSNASPAPTPAPPGEGRGLAVSQSWVPASAGMSGLGVNAAAATQISARAEPATAAVREIAARTSHEVRKAAHVEAPKQPQPLTQDFTRLLAKRLDGGASEFELRLDPPELGRVEAKLGMGDDGKAVLALKFDNQAALDLFARDANELRAALLSAGFDSNGADISFSLNDRGEDASERAAPVAARLPVASEHSFLAPVSTGVMDISV
jgi:flagellar hook-length control protein FliK